MEATAPKRRLVTRSDFDGLACAMMLRDLDLVDEIKFVHPKDVQDGKIELTKSDITTNLPYDPRVGNSNNGSNCGAFYVNLTNNSSNTNWNNGAALSYLFVN